VWNHANVLCLSNRTLSDDMAREILDAWFDTEPGTRGTEGVARMNALDERQRAGSGAK
jgi:ribose 5-phosphate isomerase B